MTKKNYYEEISENYFNPDSSRLILEKIKDIDKALEEKDIETREKKVSSSFDELYDHCSKLYTSSLSYSLLTSYIYRNTTDENNKTLLIETVSTKSESKFKTINEEDVTEEDYRAMKVIYKIIQHMTLADVQIRNLNQGLQKQVINQKETIDKLSTDFQDLNDELNETISKLNETKSTIYTEFIAILGIFSALIFGLFGSFDAVSSALTKISSKSSVSEVLVFTCIIIIPLLILIYGLLYWVGKLANKKLSSCQCESSVCNCSIYEKHKTFFIILQMILIIFMIGLLGILLDQLSILQKPYIFIQIIVLIIVICILLRNIFKQSLRRKLSVRKLLIINMKLNKKINKNKKEVNKRLAELEYKQSKFKRKKR